jgi:hypothetical protein
MSLTHGAEPFFRTWQLCRYSRTSQHFMEPEGSLPFIQCWRVSQVRNQLYVCFWWFLAWFTLRHCRWRRYVLPKRPTVSKLHGMRVQKTMFFTVTSFWISDPTQLHSCWIMCLNLAMYVYYCQVGTRIRGAFAIDVDCSNRWLGFAWRAHAWPVHHFRACYLPTHSAPHSDIKA